VDFAPIIGEIEQAYTNHQIETLVIGTPGGDQVNLVHGGTDARPWLSEGATAGNNRVVTARLLEHGRPTFCHFDLDRGSDIEQELAPRYRRSPARSCPASTLSRRQRATQSILQWPWWNTPAATA